MPGYDRKYAVARRLGSLRLEAAPRVRAATVGNADTSMTMFDISTDIQCLSLSVRLVGVMIRIDMHHGVDMRRSYGPRRLNVDRVRSAIVMRQHSPCTTHVAHAHDSTYACTYDVQTKL